MFCEPLLSTFILLLSYFCNRKVTSSCPSTPTICFTWATLTVWSRSGRVQRPAFSPWGFTTPGRRPRGSITLSPPGSTGYRCQRKLSYHFYASWDLSSRTSLVVLKVYSTHKSFQVNPYLSCLVVIKVFNTSETFRFEVFPLIKFYTINLNDVGGYENVKSHFNFLFSLFQSMSPSQDHHPVALSDRQSRFLHCWRHGL